MKNKLPNHYLGQPLETHSFLVRKETIKPNGTPFNDRWKVWIEQKFKTPKDVVVVGARTLSNGIITYDDCTVYQSKEYFKALLVVEKLSSKPFYIKQP